MRLARTCIHNTQMWILQPSEEPPPPPIASQPPTGPPNVPILISQSATLPTNGDASKDGLKTTDGWGTPSKKAERSDSQKKEKRQRTLSLKTRKHTSSFKEKYKVGTTTRLKVCMIVSVQCYMYNEKRFKK